jgi:hypothetical protein
MRQNTRMLVPNTRVLIQGDAGEAIGHVLNVDTVDNLPDISGHPVEMIRDWLKETKVERVALILYDYKDVPVMFSVLEIAGRWYDLQGNKLRFEVIGVYRG